MKAFQKIRILKRWSDLYCLLLLGVLPGLFVTCITKEKKPAEASIISSLRSTLFLNLEQDEQVRASAFAILNKTDKKDYSKLSSLYTIISDTYKNSFHYDSCILYAKVSHALVFKTNNKDLQVLSTAHLLKLYVTSINYTKETDSLFNVINSLERNKLPLKTQAIILNAIGSYYLQTGKRDLALYAGRHALSIYKDYLLTHIPDKEDSANIGFCYIEIGYTYAAINYTDKFKPIISESELSDGLQTLQNARKWLNNNNAALSSYYITASAFNYQLPPNEKIRTAILYKDSLVNLAKITRYNFNDCLLLANQNLCNLVYYSSLVDTSIKQSDWWQYFDEAFKYNHHLINPMQGYILQWQKGTLYLRAGKYAQCLSILLPLKKYEESFTFRQQQIYLNSIILSYWHLNKPDSLLFYYKEYLSVTDSLITINLQKAITDAEDKYQSQLKQEKIESQNLIIEYAAKEKIWLFIGIFSLASLTILLIFFYRNKRIAAQKLDMQNAKLNILNQQLDEANQTKSKLFAIISHDLRGPILQLYFLLKLQANKDAVLTIKDRLEYDEEIQFATANLRETIDGLLTWSKTQMQSFAAVKSMADITKLVRQCINLMNPLIDSKHLQVDNRIDPDKTIEIETDANFLLAIFRNILNNAIQAAPKGSTITIEYNFSEAYIARSVKVTNKGKAFTQQDYQKALTETKTSEQLWQGLGLQVIDELSHKINATVFFEALSEQSTCCTITFIE